MGRLLFYPAVFQETRGDANANHLYASVSNSCLNVNNPVRVRRTYARRTGERTVNYTPVQITQRTGADMGDWETLKQAAERLGMSPEAIRQRAIRGHWPRRKSNEGAALVRVPDDISVRSYARRTAEQTPVEQPYANANVRVAELQVQVDMLREMLADMRQDRDHWRQTADKLIEQAAIKAAPSGAVSDILARMRAKRAAA